VKFCSIVAVKISGQKQEQYLEEDTCKVKKGKIYQSF